MVHSCILHTLPKMLTSIVYLQPLHLLSLYCLFMDFFVNIVNTSDTFSSSISLGTSITELHPAMHQVALIVLNYCQQWIPFV
jgi:hypothetical protein